MFENDQWEPEDLQKGADQIFAENPSDDTTVRNIQQRRKSNQKEQREKVASDAMTKIKSLREKGKEAEAIEMTEDLLDRGVIAQWQLEGKPDPRMAQKAKPKFDWKKLFLGD